MNKDNRKFWDRAARVYTYFQEKRNRSLYAILCNRIAPHIHTDDTVLEIGCGTGQLTEPLAPLCRKWYATDFSPEMVAQTTDRVGLKRISNIITAVEDATSLTYPDSMFDVVVIANVLHIIPAPEKALREACRVLKPGGTLIAPTFIYDGRENRFCLRIMGLFGFHTFTYWNETNYVSFVSGSGYEIRLVDSIPSSILTECLLIAQKKLL